MKIFDIEQFNIAINKLIPYVPYTLFVVLLAMVFSILFGLLLAWAKFRKNKVVRNIAYAVTAIIRGTPFLVMLFVVFYGLPVLMELFQVEINTKAKLIYMLITLSLVGGSRLSEVFRSAYEAVDRNQMEAGLSTGMTQSQTFLFIILPQALYIAIPNIGNSFMGALMETSLGYTIGLVDIMGKAKMVNSLSYGASTFEIYVAVAVIYWVLSSLIDLLFNLAGNVMGRPYQTKRKELSKNAV